MATPDDTSVIQDFKGWIKASTCYSIGNLASDEKSPFVPLRAVEMYFGGNRNVRLNKILAALYQTQDPPTYAEAILKRYTSVFCILLEIGKGNLINHFTEHDALRDSSLPFSPDIPPPSFPEGASTYQEFCQTQWKYTVPVFDKLLGKSFAPKQILPIISRDMLSSGSYYKLWKITVHKDYNHLQTRNTESNDLKNVNTFVLKSYNSHLSGSDFYEAEVTVFKHLKPDHCILGFYGSYIQSNVSNIILEYADQGTLNQYFEKVEPPSTGEDIMQFWRGLFGIIKALIAIHDVPWDTLLPQLGRRAELPSQSHDMESNWHLDLKPSNILAVSDNASTPYEWKFRLADFGFSQLDISKTSSDTNQSRSYRAPECMRDLSAMKPRNVMQSHDIWSLGCIFSEAATWVVTGYNGLLSYRNQRKTEIDADSNSVPASSFHDGSSLLNVAREHHLNLLSMVRYHDLLTQSVVNLMVEEMLEIPRGRPTADQLWIKSQRILSKAEDRYAALADDISEQSKSTIVPRSIQRSPLPIYPQIEAISTATDLADISEQQSVIVASSIAPNEDKVVNTGNVEKPTDPCKPSSEEQSPKSHRFPGVNYANSPLLARRNNTSRSVDSTASERSTISVSSPEPESRQSIRPAFIPPRLIISDSEELLSNTERNYDAPSRHHNFPKARMSSRRLSKASLSVSEAHNWKARRKSGREAPPLFDEPSLRQLSERDHIFIVDDASSMAPYRRELRNILEILFYILKVDPEGVDLYFTISEEHLKAKSTTKLLKFLDQHQLNQRNRLLDTDINSCLGRLMKIHIMRMRKSTRARTTKLGPVKSPRPVTFYVLTDGIWRGTSDADSYLRTLTGDLEDLAQEDSYSGVQFISFGDDPIGKEHLAQVEAELFVDNFDITPSTGNIRRMLFGVGSDDDSFDQRTRQSRMRVTAVKSSTAVKTGLRRMSTTFSLKSAGTKHETNWIDNAATSRSRSRPRRPARGLIEWTGLDLQRSNIDFLFIHGLDGDREKDWLFFGKSASESFNWPRALQSSRFPNARLLSYGFDSTSWHSPYPIKDVITAQALDLIRHLSDYRSGSFEQAERPLIIIAQGVGGLIAKSALLQSHLAVGLETRVEKGIKLSTTGIILLEHLDSQISEDIMIPAVFESHHAGNADSNSRKSTTQDAIWLGLQLASFQSISNCFSLYRFHSFEQGVRQPHVSFLPSTKFPSNLRYERIRPRILNSPKQISEEPTQIRYDDEELRLVAGTNTIVEVERINNFRGELDPSYQALVQKLDILYREATQKSRDSWAIYKSERVSAETKDEGFNKSEMIRLFPSRNFQFTGRHTDLDSIYSALFSVDKGNQSKLISSTVEIHGVGGIGKTELALEFIHRYKQKFSTILWIDSQSRVSVHKSFSRIYRTLSRNRTNNAIITQASRFDISGSTGSTSSGDSIENLTLMQKPEPQGLQSYSADLTKAWLAKENNDRWIMVFDGVDDENKSWIQEFLPNAKNGHILITSRNQDLLKCSTGLQLGPMSEEDATKLLLCSCPNDEEKAILQLVKRLNYVPLAITQAASYITSSGITVSDYLDRFKETPPGAWADYTASMSLDSGSLDEVLELSYQNVRAKDDDALNLLIMCSFMAAENIPGVVLEAGSNQSGHRLNDIVDTLSKNGFGHREENLQSFRMHTMVQSWVRKRLTPEKQVELAAKALSTLATVVESERLASQDSKVFQGLEKLLLGHIVACLSRVDDIKHCDVKWCVLGDVCKKHTRYEEAAIIYQKGLSDPDIARKKSLSQQQYLRFELGFIFQLQGKYNDAMEEYNAVLRENFRDPPDEESRHIRGQLLLGVYKALSSTYTRIGRMADSGRVLMEGIEKLQELFGSNSVQALQLLDICATEYYDQEDYVQAEILCNWIFSAQIQNLGIDHLGTMHAKQKLAKVYFQQGKLQEAETISEQCLTSLEKSLGAEHPKTIQQVLFLGRISTKLHKFSNGEAYLSRAIEGYEKILGAQHSETLNAREELAMCYEAQDRLKEAHTIYMQLMFEREDGKDSKIRETSQKLQALEKRMGEGVKERQ